MEPRNLQELMQAASGQRLSGAPDALVRRVCTDSRQAQPGDLFIALRGGRFDGHSFLGQVAQSGAVGAVIDRAATPPDLPGFALIAVENTRAALGQIAAQYRRDFALPLVAVAGSNGKTTTKELIAAVLRQKFPTLSSKASFNNDIGVPSTLLDLGREHQVAVLEFGANHPGELAPLLRLAQPRFGVITSIGREHLEFFGNLDGVVQEEGSLAEMLPADGKLFLNGDTPRAGDIARRSTAPVIRVGVGQENAWRVRHLRMSAAGLSFQVEAPEPAFCTEFRLPLIGRHQAINALLAIAVGAEFGLSSEEIQRGLAACRPAKMRLELWRLGELQVIDDSYNANADSMRAALDTLRDFPCQGRRIAVLGDMAELGVNAPAAHIEIGRYAAAKAEQLLAVGKMAPVVAQAAREAGLNSVEEFGELEAAADALRRLARPGDVVLLKASRSAGLERIGEWLRRAGWPSGNDDVGQRLNSPAK